MISGVYKIKNINTGKIYIGSAVNIDKRQQEHFNLLKRNKHPNNYLQNAWNKYGSSSFIFELLEVTETNIIIEREQYYLDMLHPFGDTGYNICKVAYSCLGIKRSDETKLKMREVKLGENNPNYGKTASDETRQKLSAAMSGNKHWSYSKNQSEETIERIRKSTSGKIITNDTKNRLSVSGKDAWSKRKSHSQPVSINDEIYISIRAAAKAMCVNKDTISHRCNQENYPNYKILTN